MSTITLDDMLSFCDDLENRMRLRDSRSIVGLKRSFQRANIYVIICTSGSGTREAYEIDGNNSQWIKIYGPER